MPKKNVPAYPYQVYQRQSSYADEPPSQQQWFVNNGVNYVLVAHLTAATIAEAYIRTQQPSWDRRPGVTLLVNAPVQACRDGDVLLAENAGDGQQAWMVFSGGPVPIALPREKPKGRDLDRGAVLAITWSPNGKRFISGAKDEVMYLRMHGQPHYSPNYARHQGCYVQAVAWSPDGTRIASGDSNDELHLWDVTTEASDQFIGDASMGRILVCRPRERHRPFHGIHAVAWTPDSRFVATGSRSGEVRLWDATTGRLVWTRLAHQGAVHALAWSPDGTDLASIGSDTRVQAWQVLSFQTWYDIQEAALGELQALAWSPNGRSLLLGGRGNQAVQIVDAHHGQLSRHIPLSRYGQHVGVFAVAYSPDGRFAAAGCADGSVQIVDLARGLHVHTFHAHTGTVQALAWSPDGVHLASGGQDKAVLLWSVEEYAKASAQQP